MNKCKLFKDPIYGYIEIDETIVANIIDTAEFQRLRNVIQTSYAPLYPTAVHNRFVHSLGVYYLGHIVTKSITDYINKHSFEYKKIKNGTERYFELFELACLLHDLGHAPFSHTGEANYLNEGKRDLLHKSITVLTNDTNLQTEIDKKNYKAAPHELMSVIVASNSYKSLFRNDEERSFFARCILGYPYVIKEGPIYSFLNCIISLLNSSIIDVDKLDYLIRDSYITGFDTIKIDYVRLLQSIRLRKIQEEYQIVYTKDAVSVIENVVYAHDAERKWIQNHPTVQYESYLLQTAIEELKDKYEKVNLFSYEALTEAGIQLKNGYRISLLCDADIIFLMKTLNSKNVKEYYRSIERRHPLWKSEAEYKAIFNVAYSDEIFEVIENAFENLNKYINKVCRSQVINDEAIDACKKDINNTHKLITDKNKEQIKAVIAEKEMHFKWLSAFKEFATEQNIQPFDFVIVKANQFNSGFSKEAFAKIAIEFNSLSKPCYFEKVTNTLKADKSPREKFFYIFYRRKNKNQEINVKSLAVKLGKIAIEEVINSN